MFFPDSANARLLEIALVLKLLAVLVVKIKVGLPKYFCSEMVLDSMPVFLNPAL